MSNMCENTHAHTQRGLAFVQKRNWGIVVIFCLLNKLSYCQMDNIKIQLCEGPCLNFKQKLGENLKLKIFF